MPREGRGKRSAQTTNTTEILAGSSDCRREGRDGRLVEDRVEALDPRKLRRERLDCRSLLDLPGVPVVDRDHSRQRVPEEARCDLVRVRL